MWFIGKMGAVTRFPFAAAPGGRPFPRLEGSDLDLLAIAAKRPKKMPLDGIVAFEWRDPGGDEQVFGAVFAVQHLDGEPWLVGAVLRGEGSQPPILSRVRVEHFDEPGREVTGKVIRDLRFGEIRDRGLARLRERAANLAEMSFVPEPWKKAASEASEKASYGRGAAGPRGGYPRKHYRRIAERHLALVASGRRDVLNALCEEESKRLGEPVDRERMRGWLRRAVKYGFLAPGRQGRIGREPGPNFKTKEEDNG